MSPMDIGQVRFHIDRRPRVNFHIFRIFYFIAVTEIYIEVGT